MHMSGIDGGWREGEGRGISLNILAIERTCGERSARLSIVTSVDRSNEVGAGRYGTTLQA